jgi:hypothetical protein
VFEPKEMPYPSDGTCFSGRLLDVEHGPSRGILEMICGAEPTNFGHPRGQRSQAPEQEYIP